MNGRKSKAFRRAVRNIGKHPREIKTKPAKPTFIPPMMPGKPGATFLGERHLVLSCGRAVYRTLKKADRKGLIQGA
jgi:hypothetical protein